MFRSKVFSERALTLRARPEPLDARLQVTAPHEWVALAALGLALLALFLWGVFGAVERSVTVSALLVQSGERHLVTSPVTGHVVEVLAGVGDAIADGQAIARVRLPEAQRQARITRKLLAAVEESAELNANGFQPALLSAVGDELRRIEISAAESIFASHAGTLVSHELAPGKQVRVGETVARLRAVPKDRKGPGRRSHSSPRRMRRILLPAWLRKWQWPRPRRPCREPSMVKCWQFPVALLLRRNGLPSLAWRPLVQRTFCVLRWTIRRAPSSSTVRREPRG